jgi:hypothetical protein
MRACSKEHHYLDPLFFQLCNDPSEISKARERNGCLVKKYMKTQAFSFIKYNIQILHYTDYCIVLWIVQGVQLATETGISLIILPLMRILQRHLKRIQTHSSSFLTQQKYSCSDFVAISSLALELLKKCRVR